MTSLAMVMVALLLHTGGAGLDTSSTAEVSLYRGASLQGVWRSAAAPQEGGYRLEGPSGQILVQRLPEPDLTYAVILDRAGGEERPSLALLSLAELRRAGLLPRYSSPEGELSIPLEALVVAASEDSSVTGDALPGQNQPLQNQSPQNQSPQNRIAGDLSPTEGELPDGAGTILLRWKPGEVVVSLADQGLLALLRY
ncbi:hypothetical protein AU468_11875 [Alkalispirochaeta sphaeroplastigenens]|uniref:Uncharacterized protein n=1 Tax=Alkalispirochaeta sphaeroplastigenens TaxID=1187066 RepID=A0A2S4JGV2_9SPIO|nr:hypothetical protein [Alkalispirochaeta sphaeroplastigenens]POQ98733.1 hypothetical protein AU468_11875 [Alkalispirochaeta sphaeroplastigenens]